MLSELPPPLGFVSLILRGELRYHSHIRVRAYKPDLLDAIAFIPVTRSGVIGTGATIDILRLKFVATFVEG